MTPQRCESFITGPEIRAAREQQNPDRVREKRRDALLLARDARLESGWDGKRDEKYED